MSFQLHIAATRNDWIELFGKANGDEILRFYASSTSSEEAGIPMRLELLPDLGTAKTGILVQETAYLAIPTTQRVVHREIHQHNGEIRHAVDQLTNSDSFSFRPGGLWANNFFLIGEMSSVYKVGVAADVVKRMRRILRKTFDFRGIYWIGPECQCLYSHCTFTLDYRYPTNWG